MTTYPYNFAALDSLHKLQFKQLWFWIIPYYPVLYLISLIHTPDTHPWYIPLIHTVLLAPIHTFTALTHSFINTVIYYLYCPWYIPLLPRNITLIALILLLPRYIIILPWCISKLILYILFYHDTYRYHYCQNANFYCPVDTYPLWAVSLVLFHRCYQFLAEAAAGLGQESACVDHPTRWQWLNQALPIGEPP